MRVTDVEHGDGPKISNEFGRGDSFRALDEGHEECEGRSYVLGPGVALWQDPVGKVKWIPGVLTRCQSCLKSFVIVSH